MLHLVPPTQGPTSLDPSPIPALRPEIEAARLAAVEAYGILDTAAEPAFDRITAMAADLFDDNGRVANRSIGQAVSQGAAERRAGLRRRRGRREPQDGGEQKQESQESSHAGTVAGAGGSRPLFSNEWTQGPGGRPLTTDEWSRGTADRRGRLRCSSRSCSALVAQHGRRDARSRHRGHRRRGRTRLSRLC